MRIRRGFVQATDHFTIIPNAWVRDPNLTRRARGLLAELLSHKEGWKVSTDSLWRAGPEGRDAVRKAVQELEDAGYLRREARIGESSKFDGLDYVLTDPDDVSAGETADGLSGPGFPATGNPATGNARTKKTNLPMEGEDQSQKTIEVFAGPTADDAFSEFWSVYPKKVVKADARKAFAAAMKRADVDEVIAGARRLRDDPNLPEKRFIPHPGKWLRGDQWEDEPLPGAGPSIKANGYSADDWLRPSGQPNYIDAEVIEFKEIDR